MAVPNFDDVLSAVNQSELKGAELRKFAMEQLAQLPHYNWCGIYRLAGETLYLDEYVGAETDHTEIPVGRGVCGTAVAQRQNQVIANVHELDNYLACSLTTKSEIVVLIYGASGEILGQIDIDGHEFNAFDSKDEVFLEELAKLLADRWN